MNKNVRKWTGIAALVTAAILCGVAIMTAKVGYVIAAGLLFVTFVWVISQDDDKTASGGNVTGGGEKPEKPFTDEGGFATK